ncbi:MAG: hypothetical protein M3Y66_02845, partial [Actinomycetota bacterium]|nr:hypothetical protein [Actinomycetota bacterium]
MRFPARRLRTRIIWTTALVSGIAMTVMVGTVLFVLGTLTRNSVDSALNDRMSVMSAAIARDPTGFSQALATPVDSIDDSTWLFDAQGKQLDGPRAGARVEATAKSLAKVSQRTTVQVRELVYLAAPVTINGPHAPRGVLVVSQNLEPYEAN